LNQGEDINKSFLSFWFGFTFSLVYFFVGCKY
jgi:hypothetical protein